MQWPIQPDFLLMGEEFIKQGYAKVLLIDDLYPIDESMSPEMLGEIFYKTWKSSMLGTGFQNCCFTTKALKCYIDIKESKNRLFWTLMKYFGWYFLIPVAPRLFLIVCKFGQPLLLKRFLQYSLQLDSPESDAVGYGLIGAYGVGYLAKYK